MLVSSESKIAVPYPVYPFKGEGSESSLELAPRRQLVDDRHISRTPSPTPSEYNALNGIKEKKTTKQKIQQYGIIAVILTVAILISVFHEKIITALEPFTNWLHDHKIGPLIPTAILIVLSFPPLFGHELVAMLIGITWDLPLAFLVVSVGTLLGEIANYFTFKYACSARGAKYEAKNISYGLLAHVVRNGGFLMVLVIRFSAIPPHFATTVFSTVGISFGVFVGAAILSLPKQFVPVYVGYAMKPSNNNTSSNTVEKIVLGLGIAVTLGAYVWINRKMEAAKPDFIYARRKARQGKVEEVQFIGLPAVV